MAEIAHGDDRTTEVVEPFTNFFVGRVTQGFPGRRNRARRHDDHHPATKTMRTLPTCTVRLTPEVWTGALGKDRTYLYPSNVVGSSVQVARSDPQIRKRL